MTTAIMYVTGRAMSDAAGNITKTVELGAFAYLPNSMSRIVGLGGGVVDPDPAYAFHTQYVEVGSGIVRCTLKFTNLQAEMGSITLRVNGVPPGPGAQAETIRVWTAQLSDIASSDGIVELSFQASAGTRYAALGHIVGECDARANRLDVIFDVTAEPDNPVEKLAASRKSIFGRRVFRRANRILAEDPPTLADPICQGCTAAQFDEPTYARWIAEMRTPFERDREQWERIYALQVLARYGMLRAGARGLGFGVGPSRLPAVMASYGCEIVATDFSGEGSEVPGLAESRERARSLEDLRYLGICADDIFDRQVSFRDVDMNAIDPDLIGFDFTWSVGAVEHLGSIAAAAQFIRKSISSLTFGGLAVHTLAFNLSSNGETPDNEATVLLRRQDLERIAVDLISRGHYVGQFKYDFGAAPEGEPTRVRGEYVTTSFGIIVRRGDR